MNSVQQDIIRALRERRNFRAGSASGSGYARRDGLTGRRDWLEVAVTKENFFYLLWGNKIAAGELDMPGAVKNLWVSDCGYPTQTTVSRLNAIFAGLDIPMSAVVRKEETVFYLNGEPVTDDIVKAGSYLVTIK